MQQGLMTEKGLRYIEVAIEIGSWEVLDEIEELIFPEDFLEVLGCNKEAYENLMKFSNSAKKISL